MEKNFKFIRDSRKAFIELLDGLSLEQLNHIPAGFNNNIIWNFGHIVVTTPALSYVRTGVKTDVVIKYREAYAKGTKPAYTVGEAEIEELKSLALTSIDQIEADYKAGVFNQITAFDTSTYGVLMDSFDELLAMTSGHDNLHFGYALAQRRIIK